MKSVVLVLSFVLFPLNLAAADGSSGCGPGWYVLKKNSLLSSIGRFITNSALFPLSTLGMVLGTSNCAKHSIVQADKKSLHFVENTLPLLKQDIARGQGQYLDSYIGTFSCDFQISPQIKAGFRQAMGELSRSSSAFEFVSKSQFIISGIPGASDRCKA